jgi:hypothetical protein
MTSDYIVSPVAPKGWMGALLSEKVS